MKLVSLPFICSISCDLGDALNVGETPAGLRRIVPILGGTVEGPAVSGIILSGGADWQVVRPDEVTELNAQYSFQTKDGVLIQVRNRGLRHGPPEVMHRLVTGLPVSPDEYYCRTNPIFEAPRGPYEWFNRSVFVASAERKPNAIMLNVFAVE